MFERHSRERMFTQRTAGKAIKITIDPCTTFA